MTKLAALSGVSVKTERKILDDIEDHPTFVTGVPNGTETGLDLGGTNLLRVTLLGNHEFSMKQQKYKVSEALKTGEASVLFDYLADSVDAFLTEHSSVGGPISPSHDIANPFIPSLRLPFPGKILTWTKGFSAKNAVGNDVVRLLQDAFDRKHLHVRCVALVNDTVGTLLSRAYSAGSCLLGAIFGTGTNGAYVEKVDNITKLGDSPARKDGGYMIINTEWGAFNNTRTKLPTTPYDNKLDRESINPRYQAFEKFISGMYLGEITRNILLALASVALNTHYGLDTAAWESGRDTEVKVNGQSDGKSAHFTDVEALAIRGILVQRLLLEPEDVSLRDAATVRWAASLVANRAARLSGTALAAVLVQTGHATLENIIIGVDGSLIQHYPNFQTRLRASLSALRVEIDLAKDGSGAGGMPCVKQGL
ncbi:uncharacterized protein B0H18DRAFT_1032281 [Fomitopsis serialis]|uniref:uncharacterized protein n=1 Tax=Fomitopsis serialis TaxID=139415 RepID=UPI002007E65D|nr:uncharacterized protein B0H18DRAFT_1032281 [Neoantrodia serialis]KAH9918167.1 hypothetical protein B0H18DRAFT_1032281 [Neoantrodia serialis]